MMKHILLLVALLLVIPLGAFAGSLTKLPGCRPMAVSHNGKYVVGSCYDAQNATTGFVWTQKKGVRKFIGNAFEVSNNGTVVGSYYPNSFGIAYTWSEQGSMRSLFEGLGYAISADGKYVGGYHEGKGVVFELTADGIAPQPAVTLQYGVYDLSADGKAAAGSGDADATEAIRFQADVWRKNKFEIHHGVGVCGVSPKGDLVLGFFDMDDEANTCRPVSLPYGEVGQALPLPNTYNSGWANAADNNHNKVGTIGNDCYYANFLQKKAVLWDHSGKLRIIDEVLASEGIDSSGIHLSIAEDISADGRIIVGMGFDENDKEVGWIVTFDRNDVCPATMSLLLN